MHIIVQTPRLFIREFLPGEQDIYLNHFNDPEVCLHLPKRNRDERINIFQSALSQYKVTKNTGIWGIFNKDDGDFIGSCLLRPFDDGAGKIELGYSLEKKYWSKGIGTEMARAMITYGFNDDVKAIVGCTTLQNIASQQVLLKAGMQREENYLRLGEELVFFSIIR